MLNYKLSLMKMIQKVSQNSLYVCITYLETNNNFKGERITSVIETFMKCSMNTKDCIVQAAYIDFSFLFIFQFSDRSSIMSNCTCKSVIRAVILAKPLISPLGTLFLYSLFPS
uniref:Uncharacterized protein n=1 Tax=Cacopsylla melanoneura TaxID=428564 RepID=A0A8D8S838_9HEMI